MGGDEYHPRGGLERYFQQVPAVEAEYRPAV